MKTLYEQDQMGWVILGFGLPPLFIIPIIYAVVPKQPEMTLILGVTYLILIVVPILFYKARIDLNIERVRFSFGPGLISKSIPLSEIKSFKPTTLTVLDGYGIRMSRKGWLYNVSGSEAVAFELHSGKIVRFGTDEPSRLCAAVKRALGDIKETDNA